MGTVRSIPVGIRRCTDVGGTYKVGRSVLYLLKTFPGRMILDVQWTSKMNVPMTYQLRPSFLDLLRTYPGL